MSVSSVALGLGIGALITAATSAGQAFETAGIQIRNMSLETGISIEDLSILKYVAGESAVSLDTLTYAVRSTAMALQSAHSAGSNAADGLRLLNLTVQQLEALDPYNQFMAIAEAISKLPMQYEKIQAAQELWGRSGIMLLPMIDNLSQKLKDAKENAQIFNTEDINKAAKATNELSNAWSRFGAVIFPIFTFILTILADLANAPFEIWKRLQTFPTQIPGQYYEPGQGIKVSYEGAPEGFNVDAMLGVTEAVSSGAAELDAAGNTVKDGADATSSAADNLSRAGARMIEGFQFTWTAAGWQPPVGGTSRTVITPYQFGGIVPGPIGAPSLGLLHGGEVVSQPGQAGGQTVIVNIGGSVVTERQLTQVVRETLLDIKRRNTSTGL